MTKEQVEIVARVAGKEGAHEALISLGIDPSHPIETQRDFAHLRWWREIAESVMKTAVVSFFIAAGGTAGTLLWLGFKFSVFQ